MSINRHRFQSDMEAAWELRPGTDETPGTSAHHNRFARPMSGHTATGPSQPNPDIRGGAPPQKTSAAAKNRGNGS
ncbi:MAG: hypothetical protein LBI19_06655 [Oscillospiraceae bacterium]|nr:hypothetical protein [Oscillospiraceae bacterium]